LEKGGWLVNKGEWDGAIAEVREAVLLDPKDELAHSRLGYPARRTKSKRSRQTTRISACIIHGEDGRGSLCVQPARTYGSKLWSRCNRIRATLASGRIAIRWQQKNRFRATINGTMSDKTAWESSGNKQTL
jgi:hypothetical protein